MNNLEHKLEKYGMDVLCNQSYLERRCHLWSLHVPLAALLATAACWPLRQHSVVSSYRQSCYVGFPVPICRNTWRQCVRALLRRDRTLSAGCRGRLLAMASDRALNIAESSVSHRDDHLERGASISIINKLVENIG